MFHKCDLYSGTITFKWIADKPIIKWGIKWGHVHLGTETFLKEEFQEWLNEYCKYYYARPKADKIYFLREDDALLYKLTWHTNRADRDSE